MKIFLIGMPYSGKSTLGKQLAEEINLPFVDLDHEIERKEGKSIPDIFSQDGEDHFRSVESQVLNEWASSSQSFVMGTGGGAPCFYRGIDTINKSGVSIFLDVSIEELVRRVGDRSDRPLLNASDQQALRDKLGALYSARIPIYSMANFQLANPTLSTLLTALKIRK
jgi:shikimate kinase